MCRNIRRLYNYDPPATRDEIEAASVQFVRKVSGFTRPSRVNEESFDRAVVGVADVVEDLLGSLVTKAPPRDREVDEVRARDRARQRDA